MKQLSPRLRVTESNLSQVPNQSGVYILHRGVSGTRYVGSASAGRLQKRIREQVNLKRGITSFQYRTTSSTEEARRLEKLYRDRLNPDQRYI